MMLSKMSGCILLSIGSLCTAREFKIIFPAVNCLNRTETEIKYNLVDGHDYGLLLHDVANYVGKKTGLPTSKFQLEDNSKTFDVVALDPNDVAQRKIQYASGSRLIGPKQTCAYVALVQDKCAICRLDKSLQPEAFCPRKGVLVTCEYHRGEKSGPYCQRPGCDKWRLATVPHPNNPDKSDGATKWCCEVCAPAAYAHNGKEFALPIDACNVTYLPTAKNGGTGNDDDGDGSPSISSCLTSNRNREKAGSTQEKSEWIFLNFDKWLRDKHKDSFDEEKDELFHVVREDCKNFKDTYGCRIKVVGDLTFRMVKEYIANNKEINAALAKRNCQFDSADEVKLIICHGSAPRVPDEDEKVGDVQEVHVAYSPTEWLESIDSIVLKGCVTGCLTQREYGRELCGMTFGTLKKYIVRKFPGNERCDLNLAYYDPWVPNVVCSAKDEDAIGELRTIYVSRNVNDRRRLVSSNIAERLRAAEDRSRESPTL